MAAALNRDQRAMAKRYLDSLHMCSVELVKGVRDLTREMASVHLSLIRYAIRDLSNLYGYEGPVSRQLNSESQPIRTVMEQIRALEVQLAERRSVDQLAAQLKAIGEAVETFWQQTGLGESPRGYLDQWGGLHVDLPIYLEPILRRSSRQPEGDAPSRLRQEGYLLHESEPDYFHVVDCDENRQRLTAMIQKRFPSLSNIAFESGDVQFRHGVPQSAPMRSVRIMVSHPQDALPDEDQAILPEVPLILERPGIGDREPVGLSDADAHRVVGIARSLLLAHQEVGGQTAAEVGDTERVIDALKHCEDALQQLATLFRVDLDADAKTHNKQVRLANNRIVALEAQLNQPPSLAGIKQQAETLYRRLYAWWKEAGFNHVSKPEFLLTGVVRCELCTMPWRSGSETTTPVSDASRATDLAAGLIEQGYQLYPHYREHLVLDVGVNRTLLAETLRNRFPSARIWEFDHHRLHNAPGDVYEMKHLGVTLALTDLDRITPAGEHDSQS